MKHDFQSGGPGSMNKRGSQQHRRGGQGSQGVEQKQQEITLHKSENAYKPMLFQKDVDADDEARETQVNDAGCKVIYSFSLSFYLTPHPPPHLSFSHHFCLWSYVNICYLKLYVTFWHMLLS